MMSVMTAATQSCVTLQQKKNAAGKTRGVVAVSPPGVLSRWCGRAYWRAFS